MKKGLDSKVKKSLVRDCEKKVSPSACSTVIRDVGCSKIPLPKKSQKEKDLTKPTLCSSEALANYLSDVKVSAPPSASENLCIDRDQLNTKITKKLNFHFNDKIYRNLIEINNSYEQNKKSKERRPSTVFSKKDIEPNIDDFYEDIIDSDSPPNIPIFKPKLKKIKKVENGQLHKIVSAFENL